MTASETPTGKQLFGIHISRGFSEDGVAQYEFELFASPEERRTALLRRIREFAEMLGEEVDDDTPLTEIERLFRLDLEPDGTLTLFEVPSPNIVPLDQPVPVSTTGSGSRTSEKAAERIEEFLNRESTYDFAKGDSDIERRSALRDLLADVLHAADEWGYDIEQLGLAAVKVVSEENELDDDSEFIAQATRSIEEITSNLADSER